MDIISNIVSFILGASATIFVKPWAYKKIGKNKNRLYISKEILKNQFEGAKEFSKFYENLLPKKNIHIWNGTKLWQKLFLNQILILIF